MLIERIDIESFGKLKNVHIAINNRINVFYGANESGKSTIAAFIKFMFFGCAGAKNNKIDDNEKKLYTPWDANKIAGSLIVHYKDRKYKIEREYSEAENTRIIDLSTNTSLQEVGQPGEFFFRMSEEAFSKTAFLKQLDPAEIGGENLSVMIHNILFTADEDLNTQKTLQRLIDAKNILLSEDKTMGTIYTLEKRRADLDGKFEASRNEQRELLKIEGNIKELEEKMLVNNAKRNEFADELENYRAYNARQELNKIEVARKQAETLKQAELKVIEKHAHNDFVPTMEFSRSLMECAKQVAEKKEKLRLSAEQHNISLIKYNDCDEKNKNFKIIENAGGIEEIGGEYIRKKNRARRFKTLKVSSAVLSVLALAGGTGLYLLDIFTNITVMAAAALVFVIFGAAFTFAEKRAKLAIVEYYEMFDFKTESDFAYVLDDYPDTEAQLSILQNDLDKCGADVLEKEKAFDESYSAARELLLKWNRTPESDDKKAEDFIKYAKLASEAAEEIQKAQAIYEQYKQKVDLMLEGVDERALRKLAAAARKPNYDENHIVRQLGFLDEANRKMRAQGNEHSKNLSPAKLPDPVILQSQIKFLDSKIEELTVKQNALALAIDTLAYSCAELRNSVSPALSSAAGESFKLITGNKYEELFVGSNLEMIFEDAAALRRSVDYLSAGTRDAAYLCLRMALLDLLFESEMPPLICDESFLRLDSSRLENLTKVLGALSRKTQIFLFTCHERELNFFNSMRDIDGRFDTAVLTMNT